jgi:hypothetical protein
VFALPESDLPSAGFPVTSSRTPRKLAFFSTGTTGAEASLRKHARRFWSGRLPCRRFGESGRPATATTRRLCGFSRKRGPPERACYDAGQYAPTSPASHETHSCTRVFDPPHNEQLLLTAHATAAAGSLRSPAAFMTRAAAELRAFGGYSLHELSGSHLQQAERRAPRRLARTVARVS